jgi:hypothetical protein
VVERKISATIGHYVRAFQGCQAVSSLLNDFSYEIHNRAKPPENTAKTRCSCKSQGGGQSLSLRKKLSCFEFQARRFAPSQRHGFGGPLVANFLSA